MQRTGARVAAVVGVVLLAAAALAVWLPRLGDGSTRDFPDGIRMLCTGEACGHAFDTTLARIAEVRAVDDTAPVPCPECGGPSVRGSVCPSCDGTYPYRGAARDDAGEPACPLCGEALPRLTPGG